MGLVWGRQVSGGFFVAFIGSAKCRTWDESEGLVSAHLLPGDFLALHLPRVVNTELPKISKNPSSSIVLCSEDRRREVLGNFSLYGS